MSIELIKGETYHARQDDLKNAFRYSIDYLAVDLENPGKKPLLFGRFGLWNIRARDHGGQPGQGEGAAWVRRILAERGLDGITTGRIELLAQPRQFWHVFNPVSFWLCHDHVDDLRVVIAEVTNTYGDRHSYICIRPDHARITAKDELHADKLMHVSPFQPVAGHYRFRFDMTTKTVNIRILYETAPGQGLIATLTGTRQPLTNTAILSSALRRPFGARRVLALIHWQALKLWKKGALFRPRPKYDGKGVS